ncbi:hypothetical protein RIF29_20698 [Crotalaria pallida]|uniref:Secreted protein n=1 Tax=Crotalaria pallida TaxID=3830 RepID=A0AAN9ICP3_CROPI
MTPPAPIAFSLTLHLAFSLPLSLRAAPPHSRKSATTMSSFLSIPEGLSPWRFAMIAFTRSSLPLVSSDLEPSRASISEDACFLSLSIVALFSVLLYQQTLSLSFPLSHSILSLKFGTTPRCNTSL